MLITDTEDGKDVYNKTSDTSCMNLKIIRIESEKLDFLEDLASVAENEGVLFIRSTIIEWNTEENNFSRNGEHLFGAYIENECIGIGGINIDPYVDNFNLGRVRRLYVLPEYRRKGVGRKLLSEIIRVAELNFTQIRLYTDNKTASIFYESNGFKKSSGYKESHTMKLK